MQNLIASENKLTERQQKVIELMAAGKSHKEIAWDLGVSRRTVECHRQQIARRSGACGTNVVGLLRQFYDFVPKGRG